MQATSTTANDSETSAEFDLPDVSDEKKAEIGEFLVEQIILDLARRTSPVSGQSFQGLSDEYRERKEEEGLPGIPNLELTGDMISELDYRITPTGIKVGVFGSSAPKADGHNNLSGKSKLPTRQFIPDEGEGFRPGIANDLEDLVEDALVESIDFLEFEDELSEVASASELYALLGSITGLQTRGEIRALVLRNPNLFNSLGLFGADQFL
jgi:hypothetical protein